MKKIFIDGGARRAESLEIIAKDMPQYLNFDLILYEPNPMHKEYLEELSAQKNFKFVNAGIWDKAGMHDFYLAIDFYGDQGSTLCIDKKEKLDLENPIKVITYDIVDILNQYSKDDYIVLKLDIEGGEYDVIQRLIDTNNIGRIKEYIIEWHEGFFEGKRKPKGYFVDIIKIHSIYKDWVY